MAAESEAIASEAAAKEQLAAAAQDLRRAAARRRTAQEAVKEEEKKASEPAPVPVEAGDKLMEGRPAPVSRKRGSSELYSELPDLSKNSLSARRRAQKEAMTSFAVGEKVRANYGASRGQPRGYYDAVIAAVHDGGDRITYDLDYDDGDKERKVLAKFVEAQRKDQKPPEPAPEAPKASPATPKAASSLPKPVSTPPKPVPAPKPAPTPPKAAPEPPKLAPAPPKPVPAPAIAEPVQLSAATAPIAKPVSMTTSNTVAQDTVVCADFLYNKPWHKSAKDCLQHGCMLRHVILQDFVPGAQRPDREKLRKKASAGQMLGLKSEGAVGAGSATMREKWWWHEGDPALAMAKSLFGK